MKRRKRKTHSVTLEIVLHVLSVWLALVTLSLELGNKDRCSPRGHDALRKGAVAHIHCLARAVQDVYAPGTDAYGTIGS